MTNHERMIKLIIRKHLVPTATASKVTSGKGNTRRKICIHETDNTKDTSNADAHSRLQYNGNSRQASWHWQVDDKEAVQSFEHSYKCWAAGSSKGNNEAIHVEICVNSDGNYLKAVENAASLVAKIMKDEKLTINDVVQHNYYSGKNCPRIMRSESIISWSEFKEMIEGDELTVSQVNQLRAQINELRDTLNSVVNNKANKVSHTGAEPWAKDAVDWAHSEGILTGNGDGLNLSGALTREQLVTILYRYHNKYVKNE